MNLTEQVMGDEAAWEQAWHQVNLEREQIADECLKKLAEGRGGQVEIEFLASFARLTNPYERRGMK